MPNSTGAPNRRGTWRRVQWFVLAVLLTGCGEPDPSNPAATFAQLSYPGGECPLVGAADVTFRIEPYAGEPVMAVQDDGMALRVRWPQDFAAGTYDDPVVRDPAGRVVARDGQRLIAPAQGFPHLPGGWAVCFGGGAIWVQNRPLP
jgi:hypothetical protein